MGDINNPQNMLAMWDNPTDSESHTEGASIYFKSNVEGEEHPILSSKGLIDTINFARKWANTEEKELKGEIKDKVFEDVTKVAFQYKISPDLILFCMDWDKDITSASGGEANGIAQKIIGYSNELRQVLKRDPMYGEILQAHGMNGAAAVKKWYELSKSKPDEIAQSDGSKKANIIFKKLRNGKPVPRTNLEVYDFWHRRMNNGKTTFNDFLGNVKSY